MGRNCFSAETTHSIAFAWWVPVDHGNEIQSDSATFSLGLYTEQCRHNQGAGAGTAEELSMPERWTLDGTAGPTTFAAGDGPRYGTSVGVGEGGWAVGAPLEDHSVDAGSVYVDGQEFEPGSFADPPLVDDSDEFGTAVAYETTSEEALITPASSHDGEDLELLVVGAPGDGAGTVYLLGRGPAGSFLDTDGEWELAAEPVDSGTFGLADGARFGAAVDVIYDLGALSVGVLVGAPGANDGEGAAFGASFEQADDGGYLLELDMADSGLVSQPDPNGDDRFGAAVAIDAEYTERLVGATVLVGAPGATANGQDGVGGVYNLTFGVPIKYVPSDGNPGDEFGAAVGAYVGAIEQEALITPVVGAPGREEDDGGVYVYEQSWVQLTDSDGSAMAVTDQIGTTQLDEQEEVARLPLSSGAFDGLGRFGSAVAAFRTPSVDGPSVDQVGAGYDLNVGGGAPADSAGSASLFRAPIQPGDIAPTIGDFESRGTFTPGSGAAEFGASLAYYREEYHGPVVGCLLVGAPGSNGDQGLAYGFDYGGPGDW
jgi:hypothetical protein